MHVTSELYDVAGFKAGAQSLTRHRAGRARAAGRRRHPLLTCSATSASTRSAGRAAAQVTGVDFSGKAIASGAPLADEVGLSARATFLESDVYDLPGHLAGQFDVVFTSWGALAWLGDLERWADVVARFLTPGGVFYLAEFHPFAFLLADDATPRALRIGYPYFQYGEPLRFDEPGSYADPQAAPCTPSPTSGTTASPRSSARCCGRPAPGLPARVPATRRGLSLPFLERGADGLQRVKGHQRGLPLSFSLLMAREA